MTALRLLLTALLSLALFVVATPPAQAADVTVSGRLVLPFGSVNSGTFALRPPSGAPFPARSVPIGTDGSYSTTVPTGSQYFVSAEAEVVTGNGDTVQFQAAVSQQAIYVGAAPVTYDLTPLARRVQVELTDPDGAPVAASASVSCSDAADTGASPYLWTSTASGTGTLVVSALQLRQPQRERSSTGCVLTVRPAAGGPALVRRLVLDQDDLTVPITVSPRMTTISGQVSWPYGALDRSAPGNTVQVRPVGLPSAEIIAMSDIAADGSWSVQVRDLDSYDVVESVRGTVDRALGGLRHPAVAVDGPTQVTSTTPFRPVRVHAVDRTGAYVSGTLYPRCLQQLRADPQVVLDTTRSFGAGPVELPGLVTGADVDCHVRYVAGGRAADSRSFVVPTGTGAHDVTVNTYTGQVFAGLPTASSDADGVIDLVEAQAPNNGDGNGDGTPDAEQQHVTSLPAATGGGFLTLAGADGTTLVDVSTTNPGSVGTPLPGWVSMPAGLASFTLRGIAPGSTQTVSIYPRSMYEVNGYAKYDTRTGQWRVLPDSDVVIAEDHLEVTLRDGGPYDLDGLANGEIVDPGGPAVVTTPTDTTPPTVTGKATTAPNAAGWYRGDVTIEWTASDDGSGVADQPEDSVIDGEGAGLGATSSEVCDQAGNCATGSVSGIKIDRTAPTVTTNVDAGAQYVLGTAPVPTCTATDGLSEVDGSCSMTVTAAGNGAGVGFFTAVATATDKAGNKTEKSVSWQVVYRFAGFQQPVNDPALTPGTETSTFAAGKTVVTRFELTRADGSVVQPVAVPEWVQPERLGTTTAKVNEQASAAPGTSGTRYVRAPGRWQYDWSTKGVTAGRLYRLAVRLDDGTTRSVVVGLR